MAWYPPKKWKWKLFHFQDLNLIDCSRTGGNGENVRPYQPTSKQPRHWHQTLHRLSLQGEFQKYLKTSTISSKWVFFKYLKTAKQSDNLRKLKVIASEDWKVVALFGFVIYAIIEPESNVTLRNQVSVWRLQLKIFQNISLTRSTIYFQSPAMIELSFCPRTLWGCEGLWPEWEHLCSRACLALPLLVDRKFSSGAPSEAGGGQHCWLNSQYSSGWWWRSSQHTKPKLHHQ